MIPRAFIDDLHARVDIVSVIEHYVPLKKSGIDGRIFIERPQPGRYG